VPAPKVASRVSAAVADEDLAAGLARHEESAVRETLLRHNQRLYRLARSVLRNDHDAEDVLQQAYVQAFTHIGEFRGEAKLSTWLSRIVLNEAFGRLRQGRRAKAVTAAATREADVIAFPRPADAPDPERSLAQRQVQALLERVVDELPEAFRTVLVARVVEGMSVEETATLLGLKPETVKTRLHRARALVKADLERQLGAALTTTFPFAGWRCERLADAVVSRLTALGHFREPLPASDI
jgi:RNA polymerase sigma-70 factor (ECF subfamily)